MSNLIKKSWTDFILSTLPLKNVWGGLFLAVTRILVDLIGEDTSRVDNRKENGLWS